ncbi:hypothetical protein CKM354_000603100 [Cercospora kikuchii]|uniref:Uncharacterized protein n=1 Tax=Cercospora kikuchii TaxID=84275 RepID=A0A9P3CHD4_9PEZI|nr:uncharacterized protein CKM354_000603100 [Cercospora kikuchii]GIZ42776.1 hypothetical protein CKM354_000603100 [Cercospora kikuchii]
MLSLVVTLSLALHASAGRVDGHIPKPFGAALPVATLVAQPDLIQNEDLRQDSANTSAPQPIEAPDVVRQQIPRNDQKTHVERWGAYTPYGEEDDQTLVRRGIFKRAPAYRGTMMMDCKKSREACQNACWYQNCMMGAQGSATAVTYTYGGNDDGTPEYAQNRVESGVATSGSGTPCGLWPFGQLFWDPYPFHLQVNPDDPSLPPRDSQLELQTDEWPMANWENPTFDPTANPSQHSLRCITRLDNSRGGAEWKYFKRKMVQYRAGARHESRRLGTNPFEAGDTFNVEFDMSQFDDNIADDVAMKASLTYCGAPGTINCANDGRQFHMSDIARTGGGAGVGAYLDYPYDSQTMNTYKIDNEAHDIWAYQVLVDITGDNGDQYEVTVQTLANGAYTGVANRGAGAPVTLALGESMTLQGSLPKELEIKRVDNSGCNTGLEFIYGTPVPNTHGWYVFRSDQTNDVNEKHCQTSDLNDDDGDYIGTRFTCTFPGY